MSKYEGSNVLLVEGKNDCHVIMALCGYYKIPENFGIDECGGYDGVLKKLVSLIMSHDPPDIIGVVLDADYPDIKKRWNQIKNKIKNNKYLFPSNPSIDGTIITGDDLPKLGIWIMPDNKNPGMLEDFLINMIDGQSIDYVDNCVKKAKDEEIATYKSIHHSKALIHTYLAWQDEPGKPLGQSITAKVLKPVTEISEHFKNWLGKLFTDE